MSEVWRRRGRAEVWRRRGRASEADSPTVLRTGRMAVPSQLVCRPERKRPVAVLRVSGTLDPVTGDALQQAVRRSLANEPTRLLLDVAGLRIGDPLGLCALGAVVGQTQQWPRAPIVLCDAPPATRRAIE